MLYSRYSNPMDLLKRYINQRRFGAFVADFLKAEYERRKQEAEKEDEMKMWIAYVHSYSEQCYNDWKKQIFKKADSTTSSGKSDADLDDEGIRSIINSLFADKEPVE